MSSTISTILITLLTLLLNKEALRAQSHTMMEAKLVMVPGDTIQGHIRFYDWDMSPDEIEFVPAAAADFKVIKAREAHSFYLVPKKEWYYAKNIKIYFYSNRLAENAKIISDSVVGSFFLQEALKGDLVSLYLLIDREKKKRFFLKKGPAFSELINYEYTTFRGSQQYLIKVDQYRNQLKNIFADCSQLIIPKPLPYTLNSLTRIISKYHQCQGGEIINIATEAKASVNPVLATGIVRVFDPTLSHTFTPTAGIGLRVTLPGKLKNNYALILADRYMYDYTDASGNRIKGSSHQVTALAGTFFGKGKLQPFIHAGMQVPILSGFTIGSGFSYNKKVSLEIRLPGLSAAMGTIYYTFGTTSPLKH